MPRILDTVLSEADLGAVFQALIQKASVDVVLENGDYKAFLVQVTADVSSLKAHLKYPEVQSAIISAVEKRIANRQFEDPCDGIEMFSEVRKMTGWKPNTNVPRAVIDLRGEPLCTWNPSSEGAPSDYVFQTYA